MANFSESRKKEVFYSTTTETDYFLIETDEEIYLDEYGREVVFEHYGDRYKETGWNIHHIDGNNKNNNLNNLQALNFESHKAIHDGWAY